MRTLKFDRGRDFCDRLTSFPSNTAPFLVICCVNTIYTQQQLPFFLWHFINVEYMNCRQEGRRRTRTSRAWAQAQWRPAHPHVEMAVWIRPLVYIWHFRAAWKNLLYMQKTLGHLDVTKSFCLFVVISLAPWFFYFFNFFIFLRFTTQLVSLSADKIRSA